MSRDVSDSIFKQPIPLSSPGLTGRSSIPETAVFHRYASGILDAPLSRGMTAERHAKAFSRRTCARVLQEPRPRKQGRREDRVLAAPAASCATRKHTSIHHRFSRHTRPSPRNGVNGVVRAPPGVRDLIVTIAYRSSSADLAPAQGCQDHTSSASRVAPRATRLSSIAARVAFVTMHTPLYLRRDATS
jgi:hypothetical protein